MRFDELRKKFLGRGFLTALFIVAAAAALYGGGVLLKADADPTGVPASVANDPLDVIKNARLVPKQRLAITYRGGDWNINNFVFTGDDDVMTNNMSVANKTRTLYASSMGADNNSNYVFASASAEGYISSEVPLSPDLCGDTAVMVRKNLLVNSYLVRHDGGTNELYLSVREGDEMSKPIKIPDVVPTYSFPKNGVGVALDTNTAHDIAAFDWNGDGYADYLLSFCTTAGDGEVYARLLLIDGKSLYEKSKNSSAEAPKYYYVNGGGTAIRVNNEYCYGLSYRMAIGDFDGDGEAEAAVYFSRGTNDLNNSNNNRLEIYKIKINNGGGFDFSQIYAEDIGYYYMYCSVGLAAGDINGDGRDELVALTPAPYSGSIWGDMIKINVYQWKGSAFAKTVDSAPTGISIVSLYTSSYSPVNTAIADLDGDGLGELVWTVPDFITEDGEFQLNLYVNDWNLQKGADVTGAGAQYGYNLHDFDGINWHLDFDYIHHSLCTGRFFEPKVNNSSIKCSQIAVGHMGGEGNVDVGVFSWYSGSLQLEGKGWYQNVMMRGNMGPIVQAVDLYDESLIVGAPTVVTVEDNIELFMVTQAPPKHWDRVRADGSALSGYAEEDGKVTLDSFAVFDTEGYYTGM